MSARWHSPIALLLTDVVLPQMNGAELAARLRASRREMQVLYISGYTAEVLTTRGTVDAGVELLEKPFAPRVQLDRVRTILDRTAPPPALGSDAGR